MNLLLDARKKTLQAQSAQQGDPVSLASDAKPGMAGFTPQTGNQARDAGYNLFAAKSLYSMAGSTLPNRNLLYILGGTILLLAAGMAYLWYANSRNNTTPLRQVNSQSVPPFERKAQPAAQPAAPDSGSAAALAEPHSVPVPGIAGPGAASAIRESRSVAPAFVATAPAEKPKPRNRAPVRPDNSRASPENSPIQIEQKKTEPTVDPLLRDAYLAYRNGKLDEARQLYLAMSGKDAHNPDALLGLAVIAQQRGENRAAAQYFGRVLALDPRNAVANAGMSALSADDDYSESRLKMLLREQGNSAVLHFALGNLYAGQSRWGDAQQAYFNAYTLDSGNAEFVFNFAVSLDHLGQKKLAAQYYRRAMQLDPSHSAGFDHAQISRRAQELMR